MVKQVKYIGTAPIFEVGITGRQQGWQPGQSSGVPDEVAYTLVGTGSWEWAAGEAIGGGALALPARIRDLINGPIFVDAGGQFALGFAPSALVPLPPSVETTQYYVSPTGSDANNGTSWATAKASIHAAITLGNTGAVPFRVNVAAGVYNRINNFANSSPAVVPTQPCRISAVGGQVICHTGGPLTWSVNSGTTYQATRSSVGRVIDWLANDGYGDPAELTKVASLTVCRATPGSWYTDNVTVYVNRADGAAVNDANTAAMLHNVNGIATTSNGNMWIEGITQLGGSTGAIRMRDNPTGRVYARDCRFLMATEGTNNNVDACAIFDVKLAVLERCVAAKADKDGFNAHIYNGNKAGVVTVDCLGYENGYKANNVSCNGMTAHDGIAWLDVRGRYTRNHGGDCAHTNANTVAAHIGTVATRGYGDLDRGGVVPPESGFHAITGATLYMYGCTGSRFVEGTGQFASLSIT